MWAECEAPPHREAPELFWDLYAENHALKPCATFRRACLPSRRRPCPRLRAQTSGGDESPQWGRLRALLTLTPTLLPARTQAEFCFESRRHHQAIRAPERMDASHRAQNSCIECQL